MSSPDKAKKGPIAHIKDAPMFYLFLLCYTVVHIHFERNFWSIGGGAMFAKYGDGDLVAVGERVYYTKAAWCFLMVWLLALKVEAKAAISIAFFVYGGLLLALFPFRIYNALNLLLAFGMIVEVIIRRRWAREAALKGLG